MNSSKMPHSYRKNMAIFIVGLPRAGSTLWSNIIASHPDITLFTEMHFLNPWWPDCRYIIRQSGDLADDKNIEHLVDKMFSSPISKGFRRGFYFWQSIHELEKFGLSDAIKQQLLVSEDRDIGTVFRTVIGEATQVRGNRRAAVKFPVYPCYVELLQRWWPNSRVVHISRDPRSLAASKTNDPGGMGKLKRRYPWLKSWLTYYGMAFATVQYIWASFVHRRMSGKENYQLFLYENLLAEPEQTIRSLCDFCELEFTESMLEPNEGQASSITGLTASGFDPARTSGWRNVLKPWQARLIFRLTKRSMIRFGYDPK